MASDVQTNDTKDVSSGEGEETVGEMTWPRPIFDKITREMAAKRAQIQRKKRGHSASFSHSGANSVSTSGVPADVSALNAALRRTRISNSRLPYGKNSKKSRDGRRIASKRGGKKLRDPTEVLDEIELDHNDPDYDSDANDPVTLVKVNTIPADEEVERKFVLLLKELFVHGKTEEVIESLEELNMAPHQRRLLPYVAITTAMQHKSTQYELTSELLSDLGGKIINQAQMQQGFLLILNDISDLVLDVPKAPEYIGRFIARAILDEILPPKFIDQQMAVLSQVPPVLGSGDSYNGKSVIHSDAPLPSSAPHTTTIECEKLGPDSTDGSRVSTRPTARNLSGSNDTPHTPVADSTTTSSGIGSASSLIAPAVHLSKSHVFFVNQALLKAEEFLNLSRAFAKLDNIWGVPTGPKAIKSLVKSIRRILMAYMEAGDLSEATQSLLDLDCPHFYHEFVFQAIVLAVEVSTNAARFKIVCLLNSLKSTAVLSENQLFLGIRRVFAELPELQLDVPAAYALTEKFLEAAHTAGVVPKSLLREIPARPRKRFISENVSTHHTDYTVYPF